MKKALIALLLLAVAAFAAWRFFAPKKFISVLVFSKTESFRHESIAAGKQLLLDLGKKHGFRVDTTEDASVFKEKTLKNYNVVVFLNTTGDVLNDAQQLEFNRFIQAGGGFVGVHAAADTEYDWPWYGKLVGAYFNGHPNNPNVREAEIERVDADHPATKHLPERWKRSDEWYNYRDVNPAIRVLLNLDESTYEGGTNGENHPIAWCHEYDGGRAFYTGLGHTSETYTEPLFIQHLLGGILYAAGPGKPVDYGLSTVAPEESRFVIDVLDEFLEEPMELELLPDGRVLFIERRGKVKIFDPRTDSSRTVNRLNVFHDLEDGLLGLALNPHFDENRWVYLYYSPPGDEPKQHLSRFEFRGDSLDLSTEKVLLEIPTQRQECCHSAGSLEFGPDGLLYIATGDNTNPFFSSGYAPIDERPGRSPWDAQKSSANPNDLRGKILRIKPEPDGGYSIPDGNLFPKDGSRGRPEIYVMGCRNPFRISIDAHSGYLYWGDIGPDAGKDSVGFGPMGYDEVNQARAPGFFGWPYFIADNKAYMDRDFATNTPRKPFDPAKPINDSPNNTGPQELPPAQPAFIFYPYGQSREFPLVGDGGRNAMAGPVYHRSDYRDNPGRFPEYYDGKLFIYDWMRGWIMAVTLDEQGNYQRMERFLPSTRFHNPMDMLFSPDGDLYVLEYGTVWFTANPDARLLHIRYISGNRKPVAHIAADRTVGAAPLTVRLDASQSLDYDGDPLKLEWHLLDDGLTFEGDTLVHTFQTPGKHRVHLVVDDGRGEHDEAGLEILVGNEPPEIEVHLTGNSAFFFENQPLDYEVVVRDAEDGRLGNGIDPKAVHLSFEYLSTGVDTTELAMGHGAMMQSSAFLLGKQMMDKSDCNTCHQLAQASVGPTYLDISRRYATRVDAVEYLSRRIIEGGGGVWGETAMAAHPTLSEGAAAQMAKYILSLTNAERLAPSLPLKGTLRFDRHRPDEINGTYLLAVTYTDKGGVKVGPLTTRKVLTLRQPFLPAVQFSEIQGAMKFKLQGGTMPGIEEDMEFVIGNNDSYVAYDGVDLTGVGELVLGIGQAANYFGGGTLEVRTESPDGPLLGSLEVHQGLTDIGFSELNLPISAVPRRQKLIVRFLGKDAQKPVCALVYLKFLPVSG